MTKTFVQKGIRYPSEKQLQKQFGLRVRHLRKTQNLTQFDLAVKADMEKQAIYRIEHGYNSTLRTLQKLANALDVPLGDLCDVDVKQ